MKLHYRMPFLIALFLSTQVFGQGISWRGDGNWWLAQSKTTKDSHIVGVTDGLRLQEALVLRSHIDREDDPAAIRRKQAESMEAPRRLLKGLNSNQVRDGLDAFYADFRNRQILLPDAMQIVIYQINAEPSVLVETLLDSMRKLRE